MNVQTCYGINTQPNERHQPQAPDAEKEGAEAPGVNVDPDRPDGANPCRGRAGRGLETRCHSGASRRHCRGTCCAAPVVQHLLRSTCCEHLLCSTCCRVLTLTGCVVPSQILADTSIVPALWRDHPDPQIRAFLTGSRLNPRSKQYALMERQHAHDGVLLDLNQRRRRVTEVFFF